MGAAAVWVDREAERHPRALRHLVDGRARADLVEADAKRLRSIEGANHRITHTGQPPLRAASSLQVLPTHEHMFAEGSGKWPVDVETVSPTCFRVCAERTARTVGRIGLHGWPHTTGSAGVPLKGAAQ